MVISSRVIKELPDIRLVEDVLDSNMKTYFLEFKHRDGWVFLEDKMDCMQVGYLIAQFLESEIKCQ